MRGGPRFTITTGNLERRVHRCLKLRSIAGMQILVHCSTRGVSRRAFRGTYGNIFTRPPMSFLCGRRFPGGRASGYFSMRFLPKRFSRETSSTRRYVHFVGRSRAPMVHATIACMVRNKISSRRLRTVGGRYVGPMSSERTTTRGPRALIAMFSRPTSMGVFSNFGSVPRTRLGRLCSSLKLTVAFGSFLRVRGCCTKRRRESPAVARVHILSAC